MCLCDSDIARRGLLIVESNSLNCCRANAAWFVKTVVLMALAGANHPDPGPPAGCRGQADSLRKPTSGALDDAEATVQDSRCRRGFLRVW